MNMRLNKVFIVSDFGTKDYYVAAMKTVIYDLCPNKLELIDVTHEIEPGNILDASFICWQLSLLNIKRCGVLAVVDPGVGTSRDAILVECEKENVLVGPDNGLLYPLASTLGIKRIFSIDYTNRSLFPQISKTFHGRDIFARALGHYCNGIRSFLNEKDEMVENDIFLYTKDANKLIFKILHIDRFGNIITNIPCFEELKNTCRLWVKGRTFTLKLVSTFSELEVRELGILCGSSGFYEIVSNLYPANKLIDVSSGDTCIIIT